LGRFIKNRCSVFTLRKKEEMKRTIGYFEKGKRKIKGSKISVQVQKVYFISPSPG
jgi:hypothetical protein